MSRTARAGLLLLPLGPLCVALLRYLLPYRTTDDSLTMLRAVAAHPTRESAVLWLGLIAVVTLLPGLVSVFAALPASRVKYAAIAFCVPGYLCLGALLGEDQILWAAAHDHTPQHVAAGLLDAVHPSVGVATAIFVAGHVIGTVLLGVALLRTRRFPGWASWAVTVSQPLHFVAAVVLGSHALDLAAWGLTAAGLAGVATVLLTRYPQRDQGDSVTAVAKAAVAAS